MTAAENPATWLDMRKHIEDLLLSEARARFIELPAPTPAQHEAICITFFGLVIAQAGAIEMARALGVEYSHTETDAAASTVMINPEAMVEAANRIVAMIDRILARRFARPAPPEGAVN